VISAVGDCWWALSGKPAQRFLDMLGVFAELETNLRRERQLEGAASLACRVQSGWRVANMLPEMA
jgi:DNA invertase Pin-like site-specific DNA recombinase